MSSSKTAPNKDGSTRANKEIHKHTHTGNTNSHTRALKNTLTQNHFVHFSILNMFTHTHTHLITVCTQKNNQA